MFPPNQRSKLTLRKNAEHYVAYNALHVIYHDIISCNIFKLSCICVITTTKGDASVCLCAKFDQFLPVCSHFDTKRPVNSVRIATFQCADFGPLLFAFYCPLLFYENKIKNE